MDDHSPSRPGWYDRPKRWLHLNLVGDDPLRTDVAAWSRFWRETHADGVTIAAAGATAYYPTDVPDHPRAVTLDGRDLFGELTTEAKALGMRVLARFEPTNISAEQVAVHPEWVSRWADGTPRRIDDHRVVGIRDNTSEAAAFASLMAGDRFAPCINGPYYRSFIPEVMTELAERYPIDGYYTNGWPRLGAGPPQEGSACHCQACRTAWHARGPDHDAYPEVADPSDPLWQDYVLFAQETVEDVQRSWQEYARSLRPGLTFVCNIFGSLASGLRWDRFRDLVDVFVQDGQGRSPVGPSGTGPVANALWGAARGAQLLRAAAGPDRQVFHAVGAWHTGQPPLRRVGKEPRELTQMLAQVVAKGARLNCNVAGGVVHDRRWMEPLRSYYRWHADNERYLGLGRSLADVGILWAPESGWTSWSTRRRVRSGPSFADAFAGWHAALLEARVPYDVLLAHDLAALDLGRYRALVVPSGTELPAAAAQRLAQYARRTGGLVIGCGALPGQGQADRSALGDAAGLQSMRPPEGPVVAGYLALSDDDRGDPLLVDIGDTDFLPAGPWASPVEVAGHEAVGVGTIRPPLPFLADQAFWADDLEARPALVRAGRCVYLASDLDALYGATLVPDAGQLLTNALTVASGTDAAACSVSGAGLLDVQPWLLPDAIVVHLVNLTNERLYGGPFTSTMTVGAQTVRVQVPDGCAVADVRLLRQSGAPSWQQRGTELEISVDRVGDFEVLAIDLASS